MNFVTNGGRVLSVTALGINLQVAQAKAYDKEGAIKFIGKVKLKGMTLEVRK